MNGKPLGYLFSIGGSSKARMNKQSLGIGWKLTSLLIAEPALHLSVVMMLPVVYRATVLVSSCWECTSAMVIIIKDVFTRAVAADHMKTPFLTQQVPLYDVCITQQWFYPNCPNAIRQAFHVVEWWQQQRWLRLLMIIAKRVIQRDAEKEGKREKEGERTCACVVQRGNTSMYVYG